MNYEDWISYRYLISSKGRFLSFLNIVSVVGVAIGVMALIVVTGVMTGFGNNLREKIIGTTPHIVIEKEIGIPNYQEIIDKVKTVEGIVSASPFIQGNTFLEMDGKATGLIIRGIDPKTETQVTKINDYIIKGNLDDLKGDSIIVGTELARYYGLSLGDTITLIAPRSGISGKGWKYKLKIVGTFKSGMADYDLSFVLTPIEKTRQIFNMQGQTTTSIGLRVEDPYKANDVKMKIWKAIGYSFLTKSWIDINQNLFEALWLEKWGLFLILTLMILVASFNIISTLIVTVTSKVQDIGILKSIGVPKSSIRKIFTKLGMFIGSMGTFWGLVGGIGVSYALKTYVKVPSEIYSIDHVPVDLQLTDMLIIVGAAMLITYFATIYPAAKAANLQPVEALRYE